MQEASIGCGEVMERLRSRVWDLEFKVRHRNRIEDFTRDRLLPFPVVVLWLLQKTTRSVQRHAQSFFRQLFSPDKAPTVSSSALTQARGKLRHTAFIELNQEVLLPAVYASEHGREVQYWRGHRLLGVDGSTVRLPNHWQVVREFGSCSVSNTQGDTGQVFTMARLSILYDLLNDMGLDAKMCPPSTGERDLALDHLEHIKSGDVVVCDRGFDSFFLMATFRERGIHFIGRCSNSSFGPARDLFLANQAGCSRNVRLKARDQQLQRLRKNNLPVELNVRFVSVRLPNGELEVLVTSLLDEGAYPTEEFLEVYGWRWRHETYYQMLKGRLDLENWTGQSLEAVRQDLHVTVLLANMEALLSQELEEELNRQKPQRKHPVSVNHAVGYHALKEHLLDLLYSDTPVQQTIQQIQRWMRCNPVAVRKRKVPRRPPSAHRTSNFQRNIRKSIF